MTKWGFNSRITFLKNLGKKCRETCISRLNQRNVILEESRFTCFSLKNIRELHNSRRERLNSRWLNYMKRLQKAFENRWRKVMGFVYLISQWAHHVVKLLTFTITQWAHQLVSSPCGENVNFHYSPMSSIFGEIIIFQFVGEHWTPIK